MSHQDTPGSSWGLEEPLTSAQAGSDHGSDQESLNPNQQGGKRVTLSAEAHSVCLSPHGAGGRDWGTACPQGTLSFMVSGEKAISLK